MSGIQDRQWLENACGSGFLCIYKSGLYRLYSVYKMSRNTLTFAIFFVDQLTQTGIGGVPCRS